MSRLRNGWESLQERLSQTAETVTRNARIDISGGDVDEIDPPEDIDEFVEQAKQTAIVRANLRQFIQDVTKPGYRLEGPDETVAYFIGESDEIDASPPEDAPEGGFLENSFIYAGEKRQDFYFGLQQAIWERWVRGTVLVEYLKAEKENPESPITGFHFIRPETVYPQVHNNTNILIGPDETDKDGVQLTKRDEAAAYIQFDDNSIIGLRRGGYDNTEIPLSLNDVLKQTLEPDIGGGMRREQGVFGTSVMEAISTDVEEYNEIKRDRARAVKTKAYGIWNAQFLPEVIEHGNGTNEIIRWDDDSITDTEAEINNMGPGSVLTSDAKIDLEQYESDVPDLDPTLKHYVNDILAGLPAPKYAVGFGEEITQFVSERQENAYEDTIAEERHYQERSWTMALKEVARRQGLPTEGLKLKIEPEEDDSPIMSLSMDEINKIDKYATALSELAGPTGGATTLVDRETLLTEVAQLPEDTVSNLDLEQIAEESGGSQPPEPEDEPEEGDGVGELDADAMYEDWSELVGVEALAAFSEGDWVDTPDGKGVAGEPITEGTVDDVEASGDEPVYPVALLEESGGPEFYRESDLSSTEGPEIEGVESPEEDVEAMAEIASAVDPEDDAEALTFGEYDYPDSWEESSTPNRAILLDAWSSMGGTFTGCRAEGLGRRLCASMKDAVWMTHDWRGGWV